MSIFFTLSWYFAICIVPAVIYTLKVNNEDTRRMCEICLKLAIKDTSRSGVFIVNFEQFSNIALVFPLLTMKK